jgi:hypothetical protein
MVMDSICKIWNKSLMNQRTSNANFKEPRVVRNLDAGIRCDFKGREVLLDESLIKKICTASGMSETDCLESLLTHAVGHFTNFPCRMSNLLFVGEPSVLYNLNFVSQHFIDLANDARSALYDPSTEPILNLRKALLSLQPDEFNLALSKLFLGYLSVQAKQGYDMGDKLKPYLEELLKVNFFAENYWDVRMALYSFGQVMKKMVENYAGTPWWTWRRVKGTTTRGEFKCLEDGLNKLLGFPLLMRDINGG